MIIETIYSPSDLVHGICKCCGESTEIDPITSMCPDCIEEERFYAESMKYNQGHNGCKRNIESTNMGEI